MFNMTLRHRTRHPVLAGKLMYLSECIDEEYAVRIAKQPDQDKLEQLRKKLTSSCNDMKSFIIYQGPLEVQLATNCFATGKDFDKRMLKALAIIFSRQVVRARDRLPHIAELYELCRDPHENRYEGYFTFRAAMLDNIWSGLYRANRDPYIHASAVITLSARLLFALTGGVTSGLGRMMHVRRASWLRTDEERRADEGVDADT